ncbi:MAG: tyrosine-type recombinase/integrase [Bacteroidetes bacterium]|nr:tyrosine-type recombinase/integrase [Bacteroidota bacterium]
MIVDNKITINNAIEQYLNWKSTYTISAVKAYKPRLLTFMEFVGEGSLLSDINPIQVSAFINHIRYEKIFRGNNYSLATVSYSLNILKNFFDFWNGRGLSNVNPKEFRNIRYVKTLTEVVTKDDVSAMERTLNPRYYEDIIKILVIKLLWDTGMRVSELCDLKLGDIKEINPFGQRSAKIRTKKTMQYNYVMWSKETDAILNQYLGIRLCLNVDHDYLLMSRKSRSSINVKTIQRWIKDIAKNALITKNITPHSFRHGKAHNLVDRGAHHRDIVAILRHSNPASTYHYLTLNEHRFSEVAGKYL